MVAAVVVVVVVVAVVVVAADTAPAVADAAVDLKRTVYSTVVAPVGREEKMAMDVDEKADIGDDHAYNQYYCCCCCSIPLLHLLNPGNQFLPHRWVNLPLSLFLVTFQFSTYQKPLEDVRSNLRIDIERLESKSSTSPARHTVPPRRSSIDSRQLVRTIASRRVDGAAWSDDVALGKPLLDESTRLLAHKDASAGSSGVREILDDRVEVGSIVAHAMSRVLIARQLQNQWSQKRRTRKYTQKTDRTDQRWQFLTKETKNPRLRTSRGVSVGASGV